jgi:hypothetical protein
MAKKIVTLSESELTGLIKRAIREAENSTENYMTFSNLQQMKRQIDMLLELDENVVDKIIQNGHDWADDHISTAKENLDQVFDFMMNETRKENQYIDYEDIQEGRKKTGTKLCARGKSAAKSKFKVYPSAYANGYAIQVCKGKIKGLDGKRQCSGTYC